MPPPSAGLPTRLHGRIHSAGRPLLLYVLISLLLVWPYHPSAVRQTGDMKTVLALVIEARRALAEGQFPIRVAPDLQSGTRYPQFQYYGNFPFTLAGATCALCNDDPYLAWKVVTFAALVVGGWFMRRLAYALVHNDPAAVMAGATFLCAPYLLTDLYARLAFTELIAINLLPAAFYFSVRCFRSPHWRYIVASALAWALVALSHNITYLYGVLFLALLLLSQFTRARGPRRIGRLALAGLLHAALVIWYVAPQLATLNLLEIGSIFTPQFYAGLAPLHVLLSPTLLNTPQGEETPNLGLQIGWPILAGVLVALGLVFTPRQRRPLALRLLVLWGVALAIAWSPFDFWRHLPRAFWFVQYPYRLLMFVVLFGSILCGYTLAVLFPRRMPATAVIALLSALGLSMASYYPHGRVPLYSSLTRELKADPNLPRLKEFVPKAVALTVANQDAGGPAIGEFLPRENANLHYGRITRCGFAAAHPTVLAIPVLDYPGLLDVRVDGQKVQYGNAARFVAVRVPPGTHHIAIRFAGLSWANAASLVAWLGVLLVTIGNIAFRARPGALRFAHEARSVQLPGLFTILMGFASMLICVTIPNTQSVRLLFATGPEIVATADHSTWDGLPEYAFDGLPQTAWMAGTGHPTHLTVRFSHPAKLHGVELHPKLVSLYEGWRHVRLVLIDGKRKVLDQRFDFADAGANRQQVIAFPSVQASRVEFEFSDPVDRRNDGSQIPAGELSPSYSEIHFLWDR